MSAQRIFPSIQLQADHHQPLFLQFADALRQLVSSGALRKGEQLPPLKKLADLAGVSIYTADRGVQGLIQEGVLVRRPKKGTYVRGGGGGDEPRREHAARKVILCVHQRDEVCLLPNCYRGLIGLGIQAAAAGQGADLVMTGPDTVEENIRFYQGQPGFSLLGVIFSDSHGSRFHQLTKQYLDLRFVLVNSRVADFDLTMPNVRGVFFDDFGAAYEMAMWAVARQRGRTAVFSRCVDNENYRQRVEGFIAGAKDRGICIDPIDLKEDDTRESNLALGRRYVRDLLESGVDFPALVLCVNDELARGALLELEQSEHARESFLAGFDGLQLPGSPVRVFPSVEVDFLRMGQRSVEILVRADYEALPKVIAIPGKMIPVAQPLSALEPR